MAAKKHRIQVNNKAAISIEARVSVVNSEHAVPVNHGLSPIRVFEPPEGPALSTMSRSHLQL